MNAIAHAPLNGAHEDAEEPIALYVHWPFCISKCPYCDFNSHVREQVDQEAWRNALLSDLAHEAALAPGRTVASIFFGGGTPSLMPPTTVEAVIQAASEHWTFGNEVEITLEANPSSVEAARFADLASAGVNRVSLGLQSFHDDALRFLGRAHGSAEGMSALETAQARFARVSFDLIYALPGQSGDAWSKELEKALSFGTRHLSLYQLTIEPGTRFASMAARGELQPTDPDHAADLYELTQALTGAAGLPSYETSNHAAPGEESRHNLIYWRYGTYCGVGPGAHGRRGGSVTQRHRKPENWMAAVGSAGHGIKEELVLSPNERAAEALLMGLRLREGVEPSTIAARTGVPIDAMIDREAVRSLCAQGLLTWTGERLATTPSGALLLDAVLREIVRDPAPLTP